MDYNGIILEAAKVLIGVVIGTIFTAWYKDFKDKKKAKRDLFIRMIRCRGYITIPQVLIDDLNAIDRFLCYDLARRLKTFHSSERPYYTLVGLKR